VKTHKPYLNTQQIKQLMDQIHQQLHQHLSQKNITNPCMIGIHTGGVWLAEYLHQKMHIEVPLGKLDISFYRDDFTRIGMHPQVKPSDISFDIEGQHILLVDDVVQSGRTIRAAMNEIFDYGRPASITLITLVDRAERELPIQPTIVGIRSDLTKDQQLNLTNDHSLTLTLSTKPSSLDLQ